MKVPGFTRPLTIGFAAALLAGCGAPSAVPQSNALASRDRGASGMQSEARSTDLLYAAGQRFGYIFSYPAGRFERSFKLHIAGQKAYANGLCSDSSGNVFITVYSASYTKILEYAHEGTKPIAELGVPQPTAVACASDPTSGNLAVTTSFPTEGLESVAIFADARGKPKIYYGIPKMSVYAFCAYDDGGDLFVDGERNNGHYILGKTRPR